MTHRSLLESFAGAARLVFAELSSLDGPAGRTYVESERPGGSLRYRGAVPVLTLAGTPREMGRAHGELLGETIRALTRRYLSRFLAGFGGSGGESSWLRISERLASSIPDRYVEELEGLAEGAQISSEEALFLQTFLDIHKVFFCSTFVGRADDGRPIFGRNLDFPSMGLAHKYSLVTVYRGDGGHAVGTVGWPGMIGALSGMNDCGLALAVMVVYLVEDVGNGVPYSLLFRRILEEAKTIDGIDERLAGAARTNSNNLMAADARGSAALFEIRPSGVQQFFGGGGALWSTNHFRGRGRRRFTVHPEYLSSYYRLQKLRREFRGAGRPLTIARAKRVLRAVAPPLGNLQSMIFLPRERSILLSIACVPAARGAFETLTAEDLFGPDQSGKLS